MRICIPTYNRFKVDTFQILKGIPHEWIYLFVNNYSNEQTLEEAKTNYLLHLPPEFEDINIIGLMTKGIAQARNAILNYFPEGEEIVFLDDDVSEIQEMVFEGLKKKLKPMHVDNILGFFDDCFGTLKLNEAKLWGVYPIDNAFYMSKKINNSGFIIGTMFGVINNKLRFDETLGVKEDYDFTLQNIIEYKKVCRFDYITIKAKHYNNPGGCVEQRNQKPEIEYESCKKLIMKYPNLVRINPKRDNEIIINI